MSNSKVKSAFRSEAPRVQEWASTAAMFVVALWASQRTADFTVDNSVAPAVMATVFGLTALRQRGAASPGPIIYFTLFVLFHWGIIFAFAMRGKAALLEGVRYEWLYGPEFGTALVATLFAASIFVLATNVLSTSLARRKTLRVSRVLDVRDKIEARTSGIAAVLVFGAGFSSLAYAIVGAGGFGVFAGGYEGFREEASAGPFLTFALILMGVACIIAASHREAGLLPWILVALMAVVLLPVGFRSYVMFPAAVVVVIRARFKKVPPLSILLAVLAVLPVISIVRGVRSGGIDELLAGSWEFSISQAVAEMGFTLFVVSLVAGWMHAGLEPWHGQSLIVVPSRVLEGFFGMQPGPATLDRRFFSSEVTLLDGQVGGSPVAEGLRNGGLFWVALVMVFVAVLIVAAGHFGQSTLAVAAWGVAVLPAFIGVRNAFSSYYIYWIVGGAALILYWILISLFSYVAKKPVRLRKN